MPPFKVDTNILYGTNWFYECYALGIWREEVTRIAQRTINNVCNFTRKSIISYQVNFRGDIKANDFIVSNNINSYLVRENKNLVHSVYIFSEMKELKGFMSSAVKKKLR
jgi:hypothetical protein